MSTQFCRIPRSWEAGCPAVIVDTVPKWKQIKIRYQCVGEYFPLLGKEVWIRGEGEVGDPVTIYFTTKKDRHFGEILRVPMLAKEKAEFEAKRWEEDQEWRRKHGDYSDESELSDEGDGSDDEG